MIKNIIVAKKDNLELKNTIAFLTTSIEEKDKTLQEKDDQIESLKEELRLLTARLFAKSSEKFKPVDDRQGSFFDDIEIDVDDLDIEEDVIVVPPHTRTINRGKRKPLPRYLERIRVVHQLPDSELIGPDGEQYIKIGEEISEQLDIIPTDVRVIEHVRFKYAVLNKEELGIKTAPLPSQAIPKSMASSGLLAHIAQAKYCHHLPLYRQESIWKSLDVTIPRNTMCRWMMRLGDATQPIIEEIMEQIKLEPYIQADETKITVINDSNNKEKSSHNGYMWLYNNKAGVVYDYQSSRAGKHPLTMLSEYCGYVQSDAYSGYDILFVNNSPRISVGCWAHARRKFTDVVKATKNKKTGYANAIIKKISKLYKIESEIKDKKLDISEIASYRQDNAQPILNELKEIFDKVILKTPPKGLLGKAISYSLNNWKELNRYIENGNLEIDNNSAERKIRPFTIGRKNWLFAGNTKGAEASANLFSLIENAKLFNLKVFEYLVYVFDRINEAKSAKDYEKLTPKYAQEFVLKLKPDK